MLPETKDEVAYWREIVAIVQAEFGYWRDCERETPTGITFGGMGAATNILSAITLGTSAEEYAEQVKQRDKE